MFSLRSVFLLLCVVYLSCQSNRSAERQDTAPTKRTTASDGLNEEAFFASYEIAPELYQTLSPEERSKKHDMIRAGREIWYKSTAGNKRFHTYVLQQRLGLALDWYRILNTEQRDRRFDNWGVINDPECCTPGKNCEEKFGRDIKPEETFGFDYCPGDEDLLKYVGQQDKIYRDPACDSKHVKQVAKATDQNACDLEYGTSTGALGFRKFPNPRFNRGKWEDLNKRMGTPLWSGAGVSKWIQDSSRSNHVLDGGVEPPFLIGMTCGGCHIAFDPNKPPKNPNHPRWENINGTVGNQYIRVSEMHGAGLHPTSIEWQTYTHARPGVTDTSAVPNDQINNPGTINAILNTMERPQHFKHAINGWRKVASCSGQLKDCWCEPENQSQPNGAKKPGKCWKKSIQQESIFHILKGGEDSIGPAGAVQRVYVNIGSCAETCWINHLTDLRVIDSQARNFGQTPFDIGQCRRDCSNFRAIEDRVGDIYEFLLSRTTNELAEGLFNTSGEHLSAPQKRLLQKKLVSYLENDQNFGDGSVDRGRAIYKDKCATCHSSVENPSATSFNEINPETGMRDDWLGNDLRTSAQEVGTYSCRSLHTNHVRGAVWEEYASETHRRGDTHVSKPSQPELQGRGYYRNISLLNLWAHAPFMHNNAIGPEICEKNKNGFYRSPYVTDLQSLQTDSNAPSCQHFDPSVQGRFKLYVQSMEELLQMGRKPRPLKVTKTDQDVLVDLGPKIFSLNKDKPLIGMSLRIPAGTATSLLGSFRHKEWAADLLFLLQKKENEAILRAKLKKRMQLEVSRDLVDSKVDEIIADLRSSGENIRNSLGRVLDPEPARLRRIMENYSSCTDLQENKGHLFGVNDLNDEEKRSLIAFLATL